MEGLMINRPTLARETAASPTDAARELAARVPAPIEQILFEVKRLIVGQDRLLERLLIALLSGGHVLLEGVPGLAKTVTVKAFAQVIGGAAGRIQFTPDLVPADLIGTRIYNPGQGQFSTELGPVFCNLLLADEINRAPAKVQSALLAYARRPGKVKGLEDRASAIASGASPRASINLVTASRALAFMRGRSYVLPHDVSEVAPEVIRHRLVLTYEGIAAGVTAETIVRRVLERFPPPPIDLGDRGAS